MPADSAANPVSGSARILIVRIGAMGDVLHALPAVAALRQQLPDAHIGWAIEPRWATLLSAQTGQGSHLVDSIHLVPTRLWKATPLSLATARSILALRRQLLAYSYTLTVDLQGTLRSSIVGRLAAAPAFAGSAHPREALARLCYTQTIAPTRPHVIEQACEILSAATGLALEPAAPLLTPNTAAERWCDSQFAALPPQQQSRVVVFSTGGGWGAKRWPPERFAAVAAALAARGYTPWVAAAPDDAPAQQVVRGSAGAASLILCDLPQLTALLRRAALCIAGDTGPLHLAAALGTPVLGIYGPTDPARNGPYTPRSSVLRSPLSLTSHSRLQQTEAGLLGIAAPDVINSALELLTKPESE